MNTSIYLNSSLALFSFYFILVILFRYFTVLFTLVLFFPKKIWYDGTCHPNAMSAIKFIANKTVYFFLFFSGLFIVIYYIFVSLSNRPVCLPTFIIVFAHAHTLLFERDAESKNKNILKNEWNIIFFPFSITFEKGIRERV